MAAMTMHTPPTTSLFSNNFFNIYMPCVDYWLLADNSETPRIIVAEGGRGMEMHIHHIERFNKIQSYVRE